MEVAALVRDAQRRLRLASVLGGLAAAFVALAASVSLAGLGWGRPVLGVTVGGLLGTGLVLAALRRATARWTPSSTAAYVEERAPGLDNLLVTATDLTTGVIDASARMRAEVTRQAAARIATLRPQAVAPVAGPAWLLTIIAIGTLAVIWSAWETRDLPRPSQPVPDAGRRLQSILATITPPAYLGRPVAQIEDPEQVTIPAGGRLRLEVRSSTALAWIEESGMSLRPMIGAGDGRFAVEWTPGQTTAVVVAAGEAGARADESRLLQIVVAADESPRVAITEPGRDLAFGTSSAAVDVSIDANDAEGLQAVRLAYVRMSGSGEAFAFNEGQVPVTLERLDARHWRGRARLSLASLRLEESDSVVYRALVRDTNPAADWVSSDAFTIDVGRRVEFASAGFAVPDEEGRYGLSQQMVIVKTERLQADRRDPSPELWTERSRLLAMEQRMVRAEVVFLSGGEVADEVEEAAQSHELQEGRLENAGRGEMLKAINDMSRAEAFLNGGDTVRALVAERAALVALQKAFDRRRYFLRTMAERSRIDPTRRLTGDRARAQSRTRDGRIETNATLVGLRGLMRDLADVAERGEPAPVGLIARVASVDPSAGEWRRQAARLAAAASPAERQEAARAAMARLTAVGRERSGQSAPVPVLSALRGWWAEERREDSRP